MADAGDSKDDKGTMRNVFQALRRRTRQRKATESEVTDSRRELIRERVLRLRADMEVVAARRAAKADSHRGGGGESGEP